MALDELAEPWRSPRLRDIPLQPVLSPCGGGSVPASQLPPTLADVRWLSRLGGLVERIRLPMLGARQREDRPMKLWQQTGGQDELVTIEPVCGDILTPPSASGVTFPGRLVTGPARG